MIQEVFPEIQAATEALQPRIALTETEIAEMKESIAAKKQLVRCWQKAINAVHSKTTGKNPKQQSASKLSRS